MTVSVENNTRSAIPPTLQSRLDDALADAAGLEAALEDEQKKVAELELQLNSVSSGVEYAEEYAAHNKRRNDEMGKLRRRLERRDEKIATLEAEKTNHDDHVADLEEQIACAQRLVLGLEQAIDHQSADLNEANAESAHNAQAARLLTEQVDALELTLEKQHASLMTVITARGVRIDDLDLENEELRAENARLKAAEYLHNRPSYVRGALSAVRAARNLFGRGGVR